MNEKYVSYEGENFLTAKQIYDTLFVQGNFTPMCTFTDDELEICQQQEEMSYVPPDLKDRTACNKPEEISDNDLLDISDEELLA